MSGLHFDITADNTNLMQKLQETERGIKNTSKAIEREGGSIEALFSRMTKAAAAFGAGFTTKELVNQVIKVRGEFQQLEVAFTTMLGSQEKASALMMQLTETAAKTPFDLRGVANGARQLLAYGTAAEDVNGTLVRLGNIAAGLSIPLNDLVYLYGTTMTQGRLYTQDLNQFTGRGIPIIRELAKEFDVAESEIKAMVEAGQIGFPEVQKVINNLTNEGGMFFNLMEEQSKTITGQISNIGDSFSMMLNDIGKANEGIINDALGGVSYLIDNYETVGKTLLEIVGTYGVYKAALITITALQKAYSAILAQSALNQSLAAASGITLSNAQALAATRTKLFQVAQEALNKTLLFNPYVAAAAAVAALGLGIYKLITYQTEAEKAQERLNNAVKESEESSLSEQRELAKLRGELSALKEGTDEYNAVKEKIINGYSKYYDGLEEEINQVGLTEQAYDKLTKAINRSFGARQYQQFKSQQESELGSVMADNLGKIQDRLIDKLGEEAGSKYYVKIRDAIMQGSLKAINGTFNIKGLDKETMSALDKVAGFDGGLFDITNRAIEGYIANILNAMTLTDELDRKAKQRFGISDEISQQPGQYEETFSAESESISNLEKELDKAQEKLASLKKSLAAGNRTQEAIIQQEAYVKSLQDTILVRERDLKVISEVEAQISKLKKEQKETVYGSSEYNSLQSRINTLELRLPQTKSERNKYEKNIENEQKLSDELLKLQEENEDRQIDLIKDGTEKQLAEINLRYDREIEAVKKLRAELEQAQGGKLTTEQVSTFDAAVAGIEAGRKRDTGNVWNEKINRQEQAWNRYLQEYGTFQQKRQAITEEYNRKMAEATTAGEASILQKQMEEALKEIDFNEFKDSINFADVFGNLDAQTTDALKSLREKLGEYINQAAKELRPEDLKELQDAFNQIDFKMAERDPFGELKQSVGEYKEAAREVEQAQKDLDTVMQGGEVITGLYTDEMGKLTKRTLSQEEAEKRLTDAQKKRQESLSKLTASANSIGRVGTQVVNAGNEIIDMLGAFGVSVSEEVAGALDGLGQVMSGLESIDLTKPFSALTGSVTILTGMGKTIASIFGLGGADYSGYEAMKNQYENLINVWDTLIGKKMEYIDIDYGMEAQKAADEAARLVETQINRQRQLIKQLALSGSGTGSHSLGVRIYDRLNAQDWERISELVGEKIDHEYQIWDLSAEQIEKILTDEKLVSVLDTVNSEFVTYLQNIVDYGNQLDEIAEKEKEAITGIGFESFRDSYVDLLTDLDSTNEDFADSFEKYLQKSILSSLVANQYKDRIQALYDSWAELGEDGLTPDEAEKLRQEYQQIANDLRAERDKLMNDFGWDTGTSSQQSATAGYSTTASQDSIDQMYGRFTAMYEVDLRMYESLQSLLSLTVSAEQRNTILSEIRNLAISSNGYLEDIAGFQKKIWYIVNKNLDDINGKLNKL